jgi:hypothetical protein
VDATLAGPHEYNFPGQRGHIFSQDDKRVVGVLVLDSYQSKFEDEDRSLRALRTRTIKILPHVFPPNREDHHLIVDLQAPCVNRWCHAGPVRSSGKYR